MPIRDVRRYDDGSTEIVGDPHLTLRLDPSEYPSFWYFYGVPADPRAATWGSGLFRYVEDDVVASILLVLARRGLVAERERVRVKLEQQYRRIMGASFPREAHRGGPLRAPDGHSPNLSDKYGPRGEGRWHRETKEYVAEHPELFGLSTTCRGTCERQFKTGDRADVFFADGDQIVVVEVEAEEKSLLEIGIMQALKYRVLAAAERGVSVTSDKTQAFVVTRTFDRALEPLAGSTG